MAFLAVVPTAATGQERGASSDSLLAVYGVVVERDAGNPIEGVGVQLIPDGDAEAMVRMTDGSGRFTLPRVPAGRYRLRVERLGYETVDEAIELESGTEVQIRVELVVRAVELEALVVLSTRQLQPDIPGWDRRRRLPFGRFLTREEIERSNATLASEVLRRVPSVRVIPKRPSGNDVLIRGCRPLLIVDGMRIRSSTGGFALDDLMGAQTVEAMEVYTAAHVPPEFGFGRTPCGAVVVWTRRPELDEPGDSQRSSSKRFLIAAGLFGLLAWLAS